MKVLWPRPYWHGQYISRMVCFNPLVPKRPEVSIINGIRDALAQPFSGNSLSRQRDFQVNASEPPNPVTRQQAPTVIIIGRISKDHPNNSFLVVAPVGAHL
jgi:hypothetical protein